MGRPARMDLRVFQQELAARLADTSGAQVESTRLGIAAGGTQWLMRLADAAEVVPVPPIVPVPLTKPWFLGVANVRGSLHSIVDFAGFLGCGGDAAAAPASSSRLVLFGSRAGDLRGGILVERVLGLRSVGDFTPASPPPSAPEWLVQCWTDAQGEAWSEIDLARLAHDPSFLQVGR